ncbi:PLD nuclease N-terminal domain-containing protein [Microcella daejeonensis]|uniref:PLD nuclease N-terminal domain-containing protein n=1 Tax=Microcella daejeonensis TaxID=2994971 RepID=A0A9E8ML89_9MICO|nr:PLD nuclease N-terminal domain-containing protein [Microcella daejeonensis]WAB81675.1 PLD nuclease N-terminal domain-containing protein [Microcella daejeonensis]
MYLILAALPILLSVLTLADIIMRGEHQVNHLPKTFWIILVILIPLVGAILWWTIGRDYGPRPEAVPFGDPRRWERLVAAAGSAPLSSTEAELARLKAEIAQAENDARIRRLEAEVEARRRRDDAR